MGKKVQLRDEKVNGRVEAVLQLVRKQSPLTVKQEKFCNNACVERFLRAKGDNVKKAAKHLRACLSWRESFGTENLTAAEFSAELAEGVAYVAGHDEESKPVLIFRIKPDYQKFHSQKLFTRLLVFTLEVAVGTMPQNVEQFVLLFDARYFRSASGFMSLLVGALKIVADYYPGRLDKAFVIDPPSLFSYLWMGVRPFLELSTATMMVSSLDFEESLDFNDFASYTKASSFRFDSSSIKSTAMIGSCSSRFSFTVSHHFDSLKPWHLTLTESSTCKVGPMSPSPLGPALVSPLNSRSLSFASLTEKASRGNTNLRKTIFPSTPLPQCSQASEFIKANHSLTPRPSFLQSPAEFFRRGGHMSTKTEKSNESFLPFLKFYRRPYDEIIYRSIIKPSLGGLISTVKRRHLSASQRFYTKK